MKSSWIAAACACSLALLPSCDLFGSNREFSPLEFPFAAPASVARLAAFGIPNWSGTEPHNGIDLILPDGGVPARIISPTAAEVSSIRMSENSFSVPPGQLILTIELKVNGEWTVNLVLEPGTVSPATKDAQRAAVRVSKGQEVAAGEEIGDLLVGELGYAHLHYMVMKGSDPVCAYASSTDAAKAAFEAIAARPGSVTPGGRICVE